MRGKTLLIFASGCAVGFAASFCFFKKKYDEKNTVYFGKPKEQGENAIEHKPAELLQAHRKESIDYSACYRPSTSDEPKQATRIVSPNEFEEAVKEDYEVISLTYYADGVLADELDAPVEFCGLSNARLKDEFGKYEPDIFYLRNDETCCCYEVARDSRTYEDVSGKSHYRDSKED